MGKTVAIVVALDTKGDEAAFVSRILNDKAITPLIVDVGVLGAPAITADIPREHVAEAGGASLAELVRAGHKGDAMAVMTRGAAVVAKDLHAGGKIDGMIGLGGTAGTAIGSSAMRALPTGVPKLLVSTVASGDTRPYVGTKDIAMMYSVVDIAGINQFSAGILANAAGAIAGMVSVTPPEMASRPLIAASMFGNTTQLVDSARKILDAAGYEVLVFHATGAGGQTMESLIQDKVFTAAYDVTTTELADDLCGGVFSAGPGRLDAAATAGIPQVIAPGCLDMVNFAAPNTVPAQYQGRRFYNWNENVTLMRTTPEENERLGLSIAEKLNRSSAPVEIFLPLKGISQLDSPDGEFWWPEADAALFDAIRSSVRSGITVTELDCNINDREFADRTTASLVGMLSHATAHA